MQQLDYWIQRFRGQPQDLESFRYLRRAYESAQNHHALCDVLDIRAQYGERDPKRAADLWLEAAQLALNRLGDRYRAQLLFEKALQANSDLLPNAAPLAELYQMHGEFDKLKTLLEARIGYQESRGSNAASLALEYLQLGALLQERYADITGALRCYERTFSIDPSLLHAVYAARLLYLERGEFVRAIELYEHEIAYEKTNERRIALIRELAALKWQRLGDFPGAFITIERGVANFPDDIGIRQDMLQLLLVHAASRNTPDQVRADCYRAADALLGLVGKIPVVLALEYAGRILDAVPGHEPIMLLFEQLCPTDYPEDVIAGRWVAFLQANPSALHAATVRWRLVEIYRKHDQFEDAIACLEALRDLDPGNANHQLAGLYLELHRYDEAAQAIVFAAASMPPAQASHELEAFLQVLPTEAISAIERVAHAMLERSAHHPVALAKLAAVYRHHEDGVRLRQVLEEQVQFAALKNESKIDVWRELAALADDRDDKKALFEARKALYTLAPTHGQIRDDYKAQLREYHEWSTLAEVLEQERKREPVRPHNLDTYLELADLSRVELRDMQRAESLYRAILAFDPTHARAAEGLIACLSEAHAYDELAALIKRQLEHPECAHRIEYLRQLADLYHTHLSNAQGAYAAYQQLLDLVPYDQHAITQLFVIDEALGRADSIKQSLFDRLARLAPSEQSPLLVRLADLVLKRDQDTKLAAEYLRKAFKHSTEPLAILDSLCDVHRDSKQVNVLMKALKERLQVEDDTAVRTQILRRMAHLSLSDLHDTQASNEAWTALLQYGDDREALEALASHAEHTHAADLLVDYLDRLEVLATLPTQRKELSLRRVRVLIDELDRRLQAYEILETLLSHGSVDDIAHLRYWVLVVQKHGDWLTLAHALERCARAINDRDLKIAVLKELKEVYHNRLKDVPLATQTLERWAELAPDDLEVWRSGLVLHQEQAQWTAWFACAERLKALLADEEAVCMLEQRIGIALALRLDQFEAGWQRLEALFYRGFAPAEQSLKDICEETGSFLALAQFYRSRADRSHDADERRQLWLVASDILAEQCADPAAALESLTELAKLDNRSEVWLSRADHYARLTSSWTTLWRLYQHLAFTSSEADEKEMFYRRIVNAMAQSTLTDTQSLTVFFQARLFLWQLAPADDGNTQALEKLAGQTDQVDVLLKNYDRMFQQAEHDDVRFHWLLRASCVCLSNAARLEQGQGLLEQVFEAALERPERFDQIEAAINAFDPGDLREQALNTLVRGYQALARRSGVAPVLAADLMARAAALGASETLGTERHLALLQESALLEGTGGQALERFVDAATAQGALEALEQGLDALLQAALDSKLAVAVQRARANLYETKLDKPTEAIEAFQGVLTLSPEDDAALDGLRRILRAQKRHRELLIWLHRRLETTRDPAVKLELAEEIATLWEKDLGNVHEALNMWRSIRKFNVNHSRAKQQIKRLEHQLEQSGEQMLVGNLTAEVLLPAHSTASSSKVDPAIDADTAETYRSDLDGSDNIIVQIDPTETSIAKPKGGKKNTKRKSNKKAR